MAKGRKTGGRTKGTPNKATQDILAKLNALGCDPIEGMAKIALGDVPCPFCLGRGLPQDGCEECGGTGREAIKGELKGRMYAELAQYAYPKRKAVEVTGADNGPIQHEHGIALDILTNEQLAELEAIAASVEAGKVGGEP